MRRETDDMLIYYIVGAFALDNIVNYFVAVPVYVASIPVSLLLMFRLTRNRLDRLWFIACILCLGFSAVVNFFRFAASIEDLSDILFLAQFFSAFFYAKNSRVSPVAISRATYVFAMLFLPALVGINAGSSEADPDVFLSGSRDIEFLRLYNQGMYRLPHVASYLLAFACLWWTYVASFSHKARHFLLAAIFLFLTLYTGSRTPIIVMGAAYLVANFRLQAREIVITVVIFVVAGFVIANMKDMMDYLFGSFLYQYLSFFDTVINNFDRLSRVIIWDSWFSAISDFDGLDFVVGRNFSSSFDFNSRKIGLNIWFHNDFLSAFYAYGIFVFSAYLIPHLIAIKLAIRRRASARLLCLLGLYIFAAAFVNGFYKYLPIMFFVLLFSDRSEVAAYARGASFRRAARRRVQLDVDEATGAR